jgi:hypothetical protein
MLPQLLAATYNVWVRGYGLADSDKVEGRPGDTALNLTAKVASSPAEAAKVYPGNYWLSLLQPPAKSEFPGTGESGNGIPPAMASQAHWMFNLKSGCNFCHQLGNEITRSLGHMDHLGFKSPEEAWIYRTQLGVRGSSMAGTMAQFGVQAGARVLADWTTRIANGELPPVPPRPRPGPERNVVVTLWDWGVDSSFMHDEIATDKNDPTVNGYGPLYAVSAGHGKLTVLDPLENDSYELTIPTREDARQVQSRFPPPAMPSNFWGMQHLWGPENPADPHNPMMDRKGRVWMTSKIRNEEPAWCREGSDHKFARFYPLNFSNRQASFYDPATGEFTLIDTCFATHHLQFDNDPDQTLYFNELLGPIVGWVNTREYDRTGDEQATQGWCAQIVDSNGDGKITKPWNVPGQPADPRRDTEVRHNLYSVIPSPIDNSVWGASENTPVYIVRVDLGATARTGQGLQCGPASIARHRHRFERRRVDGTHGERSRDFDASTTFSRPDCCRGRAVRTGWKLSSTARAKARTFRPTSLLQLGRLATSRVLREHADKRAHNPRASRSIPDEQWTKLRVPYPLGFYHRGLDGRIDDPNGGWKGRGLWANYGTHLIWHTEGGRGTVGKAVHFQIRPDPMAR